MRGRTQIRESGGAAHSPRRQHPWMGEHGEELAVLWKNERYHAARGEQLPPESKERRRPARLTTGRNSGGGRILAATTPGSPDPGDWASKDLGKPSSERVEKDAADTLAENKAAFAGGWFPFTLDFKSVLALWRLHLVAVALGCRMLRSARVSSDAAPHFLRSRRAVRIPSEPQGAQVGSVCAEVSTHQNKQQNMTCMA